MLAVSFLRFEAEKKRREGNENPFTRSSLAEETKKKWKRSFTQPMRSFARPAIASFCLSLSLSRMRKRGGTFDENWTLKARLCRLLNLNASVGTDNVDLGTQEFGAKEIDSFNFARLYRFFRFVCWIRGL